MLALGLVCLSACQAAGHPSTLANAVRLPDHQEVLHHPSGPTLRREWRDRSGHLRRVEWEHVRSGARVLPQLELLRAPSGHWVLGDAAGDRQTPLPGEGGEIRMTRSGGQVWKVRVLQVQEPRSVPGIVTEDEPALSLALWCYETED